MSEPRTVGLVIGGGPAPGINGVISSVTIECVNRGWQVIGFLDGFEWLSKGVTSETLALRIPEVSRIHSSGGSILGSSRLNPADKERTLKNTIQSLRDLHVDALVTVGGDDVLRSADAISKAAGEGLQVIHIPKTIDNDLRLPQHVSTLGYQTARAKGVELVSHIIEDSFTTTRWYFVVCMGRMAGFLTLGIGKASGATVTVIPEEFPAGHISLSQICDVVEGSMLKRAALERPSGVVLLAEGLSGRFHPDEAQELKNIDRDKEGNIRLGEIDLGRKVKAELLNRFEARGQKVTIVEKNIGYELRCAPPSPYDIEYARNLGFSAVKRIGAGGHREMVSVQGGELSPISFDDCIDPGTGRGYRRDVDIETQSYRVARDYMTRLTPADLEDPEFLKKAQDKAGADANYLKGLFPS